MKTLIAAVALTLTALPALADGGVATVYYPAEACAEIVSQEYSTGGGKSTLQVLEILCRDAEGNYTGFADSWGSMAGAFGFGRVGMIRRFNYKPAPGTHELRVEK